MLGVMVDFDDILAGLTEEMLVRFNAHHGTSLTMEDATRWGWYEDYPEPDWLWGNENFLTRGMTMSLLPVPGAKEGLLYLYASSYYKPVIVSNRKPHMGNWIRDWLWNNFFPKVPVAIADGTIRSKIEACKHHKLNVAIDDAPHNVEMLAPHLDRVYVLDKPWNQEVEERDNIIRTVNWSWFIDDLRRWDKERRGKASDGLTGPGLPIRDFRGSEVRGDEVRSTQLAERNISI